MLTLAVLLLELAAGGRTANQDVCIEAMRSHCQEVACEAGGNTPNGYVCRPEVFERCMANAVAMCTSEPVQ